MNTAKLEHLFDMKREVTQTVKVLRIVLGATNPVAAAEAALAQYENDLFSINSAIGVVEKEDE